MFQVHRILSLPQSEAGIQQGMAFGSQGLDMRVLVGVIMVVSSDASCADPAPEVSLGLSSILFLFLLSSSKKCDNVDMFTQFFQSCNSLELRVFMSKNVFIHLFGNLAERRIQDWKVFYFRNL